MAGTNPMNIMKQKKVLPYVICVEGNIGSGKSTLLKNLKQSGFTVIEEPVTDIWGQYLPQLYQDLKRWGFCFQMEAMDWFRQLQSRKFAQILATMKDKDATSKAHTKALDAEIADHMSLNSSLIDEAEMEQKDLMEDDEEDDDDDILNEMENAGDTANSSEVVEQQQQQRRRSLSPNKQLLRSQKKGEHLNGGGNGEHSQSRKVIIVERSALSCITIFAANLRDTGNMTKWEYSLLQRFYSMIAWEPAHILYIRADPEVCCGRITKRNRDGEGNVDPKLIENLHNKHERTFVRDRRASADFSHGGISASAQNIIVVNGHKDADAVLKEALFKISNIEAEQEQPQQSM